MLSTIERRRQGRGFAYYKGGRAIRDVGAIRRLASLAVPPAYVDVVYADSPSAPLQAMGRDAAGRWQYRYHPDWLKVRERRKSRHLARMIAALPRMPRHCRQFWRLRPPRFASGSDARWSWYDRYSSAGTSRHR